MLLPSFHPLLDLFTCTQRSSCLCFHAVCIQYRLIKSVFFSVFAVYMCKLADGEKPLFLRLVSGPGSEALSFVLKEQQTGEVMVALILTTLQLYSCRPSFCALSSPRPAIPKCNTAVAHSKTWKSPALINHNSDLQHEPQFEVFTQRGNNCSYCPIKQHL